MRGVAGTRLQNGRSLLVAAGLSRETRYSHAVGPVEPSGQGEALGLVGSALPAAPGMGIDREIRAKAAPPVRPPTPPVTRVPAQV